MTYDTQSERRATPGDATGNRGGNTGRAARRTLTVIGVVILAVGGLAAVSWSTRTTEHASTTIDDDFSRVEIDVSAGQVDIVGGSDGSSELETSMTHTWLGAAEVTHEIDGDTLRIEGTCGRRLMMTGWCETDLTLSVPAGVDVVAESSAGTVTARGLEGSANLESSAGTVRVEDHDGDLVAHSSAGGVVVDGLRADTAKITSSAGSVEVHAATAPTSLDAESSAGRVVVTLPDDETYDVEADTSAGSTNVGVATDPSSQYKIRAFSSAGAVTVDTP